MISVEDARAVILSGQEQAATEQAELGACLNRVASEDIVAARSQPPRSVSAMDGYAVRSQDVARPKAQLDVVGIAPAGGEYEGIITAGEAVRIFTGGPVPRGADRIVIQENTERDGDRITIARAQKGGTHIRPAGGDYQAEQTVIMAGTVLSPMDIALAAAVNRPALSVFRKPRVLIIGSGDELVEPGSILTPTSITNSASYGLQALVQSWGGEPVIGGILPDEMAPAQALLKTHDLETFDLILTVGGASVGDRDIVKPVLKSFGADILFEKVAVKPGKPCWHARLPGGTSIIGLPGNPASAFVCAHLFVRSLVKLYTGRPGDVPLFKAALIKPMSPNGPRETYIRGSAIVSGEGEMQVMQRSRQDSSLLTPFAAANVLIQRLPLVRAARTGDVVDCLRLDV